MIWKGLKWIGIVSSGLLGLILLVVVALFLIGNYRIEKVYSIEVQPVTIPTDPASLKPGKHRVEV